MIQTAIGLPTDRKGVQAWGDAQDALHDAGMAPYMPQLRYGASYNLAAAFDPITGGLAYRKDHPHGWTPAMIAETRRFEQPMVYSYGGYWYASKPGALAWGGIGQDALTLEQMTGYLSLTLDWFQQQGISQPWILIDEPPHHVKYGWTQAIEDRVVKFTKAAMTAGWTVGAAIPGPTQLNFWRGRIAPTRWILAAKHSRSEYGTLSGECWLYNAGTYDGLGKRMKVEGWTGYLQWSGVATTKKGPVPNLFDASGAPTPAAAQLISELAIAEHPPVEPPVPIPGDAERIAILEGQVNALQARVNALETVVLPPAPMPEQAVDLALFYTDVLADWRRELATLATYPTVVIQAEFATATATSQGETYAFGRTPLAMLSDSGVEVLLYVSPWWVWTTSQAAGPTQWLRAAQRAKLDAVSGWLLDKQGAKVQTFGGKMSVADARDRAYTDWLAEQLIALPGDTLFLDNCFVHQGAYHKWLMSDEVWGAAVTAFYAKLRAAGKKLILNAGWEMADANALPWTWPLRDYCDGVGLEIPAGFKNPPSWDWWSLYDYKPLDTSTLEAVALNWKEAGKSVYLIASGHRSIPPGQDETPFVTLAEHRAFWRSLARKLKVSVSAQSSTSQVPVLEI